MHDQNLTSRLIIKPVSGISSSIGFGHYPVNFRARGDTCALALPCTAAHMCSHSLALPLMLIHAYQQENDKSPSIFWKIILEHFIIFLDFYIPEYQVVSNEDKFTIRSSIRSPGWSDPQSYPDGLHCSVSILLIS